jgi:hypothetical protein
MLVSSKFTIQSAIVTFIRTISPPRVFYIFIVNLIESRLKNTGPNWYTGHFQFRFAFLIECMLIELCVVTGTRWSVLDQVIPLGNYKLMSNEGRIVLICIKLLYPCVVFYYLIHLKLLSRVLVSIMFYWNAFLDYLTIHKCSCLMT